MTFKLFSKISLVLLLVITIAAFAWTRMAEGCQPCLIEETVTVDSVQTLFNKTIESVNNILIIDGNDPDTVIINAQSTSDQNGGLELKAAVFPIGDWDMDSRNSLSVESFMGPSKIIAFTATIIDDAGKIYVFTGSPDPGDALNAGGAMRHTITGFTLTRFAAGFFDSVAFDKTSWNRGYLYVTYYE